MTPEPSDDKTLVVWDLGSGRELRTLSGHSSNVNAVAVTPDGQRAVSASDDKTLKVWDLETGEVTTTFTCDSAACCCTYYDALKLSSPGTTADTLTSSISKNRNAERELRVVAEC